VLGAVWAFNFLVVLPQLNPDFVALMPPAITLASKLLFALAMARMLEARFEIRSPRIGRILLDRKVGAAMAATLPHNRGVQAAAGRSVARKRRSTARLAQCSGSAGGSATA
jgi:hypothetical protein